ncbi:SDR family NAD(P)-dependent oxidoreductase [Cryptosporangium aurantiacum]|uniref:NAD(P)-dependent dehydrogenase, short-chain alcohol dehydrogenase family n=1 Tax=Cryptosporangium aurantiacum TaxID=134849 RepID=A0A1M7RM18_9ACTN|nr:SDR family oxidoreductase [Cryptosporangium aurantiacum]SHN47304.1 NAD(P)-dependent dehydrogenase, short-chain alcohol dehydrogenase family [Cryptosporangium aurantiacum]
MTDFKGLTAVVTGGGTGIGRATALLLAEQGANVLVAGRRKEPLAALADLRIGIHTEVADVTDGRAAERVVAAALDRWDRIDVLVNNAGAFVSAPLASVTGAQIDQLFRANVLGPTLMARAALPALVVRGGAIVNVSSTYAQKAAPRAGHYAAAKAALESLTRSWALELAPQRIRVNAVAPGPTETGLLAASGVPAEMIETIKQREIASIPLGRRGEPADVAHWIAALCAPAAGWMTGQVVGVDGGLSVR